MRRPSDARAERPRALLALLDAPRPPGTVVLSRREPLAAAPRAHLERGGPRPCVALVDEASCEPPDGNAALAAVERATARERSA